MHDSFSPSSVRDRSVLVVGSADEAITSTLARIASKVDLAKTPEDAFKAVSHDVYGLVIVAHIDGTLDAALEAATQLRIASAPTPVSVIGELATDSEAARYFAFALPSEVAPDQLRTFVSETFLTQLASSRPEITLFQRYFKALAEHDWPTLKELCDPDVVYHLPVPGPFGRMVSGREAFIAYAGDVIPRFEDARFDRILAYELSHGLVVRYLGSWRGPADERNTLAGAVAFRLRAGRIDRIGVDLDHERLGAIASRSMHSAFETSELNHRLRARLNELSERHGITRREREVLDLLLLGRTSAEVGDALGITTRTAKFHVANLLQKLGADSRNDLLRSLL